MKKFILDFVLPTFVIAILLSLFFAILIPTAKNSFWAFLVWSSFAGAFYFMSLHFDKKSFFTILALIVICGAVFSIYDNSIGGDALVGITLSEIGVASIVGLLVRKFRVKNLENA